VLSIRLWLGALVFALVPALACADSVVSSLALGTSADCTSNASVNWSFTYTVTPATDYFSITTATGPIGGFQQPSTVGSGGSFSGTFAAPISIAQQPNTLIGTYGSVGDFPATVNTAEYFILYNCTTKRVLYQCSGNAGKCPRTVTAALAIISPAIPVGTPALVVAMLAMVGALGAFALRPARA
jgi:hypothetical protein